MKELEFDEQDEQSEEEIGRVKLPKGNQTIGILSQRLGGSRVRVKCLDGKTRICSNQRKEVGKCLAGFGK